MGKKKRKKSKHAGKRISHPFSHSSSKTHAPISLCMIVKNEAHHLPGCLESVRGLVAEVVIVDTGSTDQTLDIARQYGARIFQIEWENHFAKARNVALKHARFPWILYLDADERLHPEYHQKVKQAVQSAKADAYYIQVYSPVNGRLGSVPHIQTYPRLFRKLPGVQFEGRIHEQITPSLQRAGARFANLNVRIEHLGYQLPDDMLAQKIQRNIQFLEIQVQEEPDNAYAKYQLGQTYILDGQFEKGQKLLEAAIQSNQLTSKIEATARLVLANFYNDQNELDTALLHVQRALHIAPRQRLGWFLYALIQGKRENWEEVARGLQQYWTYEQEAFTELGIDKVLDRNLVLQKFLEALQHIPDQIPRFRETFAYIQETIDQFTDPATVIRVLGRFFDIHNHPEFSVHLYRKATALEPDNGLYWTLLGYACMNAAHWTDAEQAFSRACSLQPEVYENYQGLAIVHLKQGRLSESIRWFEEIARCFPQHAAEARRRIAGIYAKLGQVEKAMEYLQQMNVENAVG
ncbi:MAG: glycosyltransferase [Calditrichaeota bacterium]|nr:glycosyltransferase [Calditrichota bacterium]